MKECDRRNSQISGKFRMNYISSNNVRHLVTQTFTTLVDTSLPLIWTGLDLSICSTTM